MTKSIIPNSLLDTYGPTHASLPRVPTTAKSWNLRSNFLLHLQEREAHGTTATTPAARRAIEIEWRYTTDPHLPPLVAPGFRSREDPDEHIWVYSFKADTGKVISGRGTLKQMEMHKASLCRQAEGMLDA
jgi:hypothetical protein